MTLPNTEFLLEAFLSVSLAFRFSTGIFCEKNSLCNNLEKNLKKNHALHNQYI